MKPLSWWHKVAAKRPPDYVIGIDDDPCIRRWWIIPRNRFLNLFLHQFIRSDDNRALHDHPWPNVTFVLEGGYWEYTFVDPKNIHLLRRKWYDASGLSWRLRFRSAKTAHRVVLDRNQPCWTLFITGPVIREWGFYCPQGWRHWKVFTKPFAKGQIGRGCD